MRWAAWIATAGGIGYFPVFPGTIGSVLGLLLFVVLRRLPKPIYVFLLLVLFGLGVYTSTLSEDLFQKKDASHIIIDEICAMLLVLFFLPSIPLWWIAGLIVFRVFDIKKPPPIRSFEKLPKGWGVMMDDLVAAIYTIASLRIVEKTIEYGRSTLG
ncbi:MAG: phosphatidylglycerophosphatase A [Nitrospiria bacterium]